MSITTVGKHLLLDLWGVSKNKEAENIEEICKIAAKECGADILFSHYHYFPCGISSSGVLILSASHISWHSWFGKNEGDYLSLDVYLCGNCDPEKSIPIFKKYFKPLETIEKIETRGSK